MSAKAVKQPAPPPGPAGLVGDIQREISDEASPLLTFLIAHAAKIAIAIVLFIVAIAGYWIYSWQAENKRAEEVALLGKLLVISDPAMRLEALEGFLPTAPESVRRTAWFSVLDAAIQLEDQEKIYSAWKAVSEMDPAIRIPATLGMANSLTAREQYREALALLEGVSGSLQDTESVEVNIRIALLAEMLGDYQRAVKACDAVTASPLLDPSEVRLWAQKKNALSAAMEADKAKDAKAGASAGEDKAEAGEKAQ